MPKLPKKLSIGEETLALHLRANGIDFVREYEFAVAPQIPSRLPHPAEPLD